MFSTSESTAKLDAALAKAQGEIEVAVKEKTNDAFKKGNKASKYADLAAIWAAARGPLAKHGISITQWPIHREGNRLHMVTRLAHEGEWMMAEWSFPVRDQTAHGYGGAVTYARRFSGASAVGIVTDEDDDGNAASGVSKNGNGKLSVHEPDERGPGEPFNDISGTEGRSKYKGAKNGSNEEYLFLEAAIRAQRSVDDLMAWGDNDTNKEAIAKLPAEWVQHIRNEFKDRLASLKEAA